MVPPENLLLASLPSALHAMLKDHLQWVDLPLRTVLFETEETPRYVHFLVSGIASVVIPMTNGEAVEVTIVGREGFPEIMHVIGPQSGMTRCFMQAPGAALRINFARFQEVFLREPDLLRAVHRLVQHEAFVLAQLGACNRLHDAEARLARWLLMVCDRVCSNELRITQEFLGEMLGLRRSSINHVAGTLQRAGMIDYSRGRIVVTDSAALQQVACECYPIVRGLYLALQRASSPRSLAEGVAK